MKVKPVKFQEDNLYRHSDFAPPPQPEQQAVVKQEPQKTPVRPDQVLRTRTDQLSNESFGADFDDETDENLFDGVDVSEGHGDEFPLSDTLSASDTTGPRVAEPAKPKGVSSGRTSPVRNVGPPRQPNGKQIQAGRGQPVAQQQPSNQVPGRPSPQMQNSRQPQTPVQQQPRPVQNNGRMPPPAAENGAASRPIGQQPQNQHASNNQPSRPTPPQAQQPPNQQRPGPQGQAVTTPAANQRPSVGFVTSRAAELLQASEVPALNNIPQFNPNAESPIPKEKRTPGIDHARSIPIKREAVGAPPPPQPAQQRPGVTSTGSFNRPNIVNPHLDANRRIGMPGAPNYAMSPSANRGAYKPPTFANGAGPNGVKRERAALQDVSNVGVNGNVPEGPDAKKQKVDAPGAENTAGVANT
ncbi:DNA repair protein rad52 [Exserohilum turcicum]